MLLTKHSDTLLSTFILKYKSGLWDILKGKSAHASDAAASKAEALKATDGGTMQRKQLHSSLETNTPSIALLVEIVSVPALQRRIGDRTPSCTCCAVCTRVLGRHLLHALPC